jgi:hypothetical protein
MHRPKSPAYTPGPLRGPKVFYTRIDFSQILANKAIWLLINGIVAAFIGLFGVFFGRKERMSQ